MRRLHGARNCARSHGQSCDVHDERWGEQVFGKEPITGTKNAASAFKDIQKIDTTERRLQESTGSVCAVRIRCSAGMKQDVGERKKQLG